MLLLCGAASPGQADNTVGTITTITGTVQLERGGAALKPTVSMPVELHDRFTTGAASQLTITLLDNSALNLAGSSTVTIDENVVNGGVRANTKVSLLEGTLHSAITRALRAGGSTFEVRTPNAIAGVRGTRFAVTYSTGSPRDGFPGCLEFTDEATQEGTVANWNKANPSVVVETHAGENTTIACAAVPLPASSGGLVTLSAPTVGPLGALVGDPLLMTGAGAATATAISLGIYGGLGGFSGGGGPVASPSQ